MTNDEKQLLKKDLCARLPYRVKVKSSKKRKPVTLSLDVMTDFYLGCSVKPYLRPISSMTDEEKEEYNILIFSYEYDDYWYPGKYIDAITVADIHELIDFYYTHHFDYRGLIEKDLALPAPKEMYDLNN